jgi:hypothetical protein
MPDILCTPQAWLEMAVDHAVHMGHRDGYVFADDPKAREYGLYCTVCSQRFTLQASSVKFSSQNHIRVLEWALQTFAGKEELLKMLNGKVKNAPVPVELKTVWARVLDDDLV